MLIDVILADGFSMLTTTLILEALRFVNLAHRRKAFDWTIRGVQSQSPRASNGFTFAAQRSFDSDAYPGELVFLNASYFPDAAASAELLAWLRNAARHGAWIAAVDTAPLLLAQAGLLYRKKATVHWEELGSAQERFPEVDFCSTGVEQSGRLFTCSGGMAVLDLMLRLVAQHQGDDIARYVRECFFLKDAETSLFVRDRKLSLALSVMRQFIDAPLALEEVAARCNMSPRQMQRRFVAEFGVPPSSFYTALRLHAPRSANAFMPCRSRLGRQISSSTAAGIGEAMKRAQPHLHLCDRYAIGKYDLRAAPAGRSTRMFVLGGFVVAVSSRSALPSSQSASVRRWCSR
ncbi:DJ-1/PfpI family protein [Mesorhizobium sp.]|uniref:GlxA family transcriptional regulator n=1 Tax=Mesorhizobium sp. TaxID=1871066 RepID=UPI0025BE2B34|nr:DJ-1/PfpI family protein [Mesorhizobium sp.]